MAPHLGIYFVTWIFFCSCAAMPDIHKQMSKSQLQSIFHVDDTELVPNYEIINLIHNSDNSNNIHNINKRSINNNNISNNKNSDSSNNSNSNLNSIQNYEKHERHVKKDLSKITNINSDSNSEINSDNSNIKNNDSNLDQTRHNVTVNAFGDSFNLNLVKTDGLFKNGPASLRMWTVKTDPNSTQGLDYEEIVEEKNTEDHIGEVFQDETNMAAILMRRHLETGDLLMEGSIGHELVIKPMPTDILPHTEDGRVHHVVYKRQITEDVDQLSDFAYMEPDRLLKRYRRKRSLEELLLQNVTDAPSRNKRAVPHIIYPEILVIVDYDGYRLHGGDNVQVKRYFVSFWNGVDLRYRLLKGPRIRISIAGIIISRGRDATPYLERNRVGRDAIDSAAALTDMGKYLFRERRLPVYDIAVAITKLDMCRRQYANDACNRGTAGFAYVGGACVVNKRLEKVNSVAIIEDTGGFSGIIVAAHEVGHLLGAVHDGSPSPSYLGGPGAEKCRWEDGYIMSDLRHTDRGFRWSACTVQSFHHFLNGDTASCLHNAPHEDEALGRTLPGTLLSLDAQCRRDRGTSACFKDERVCAQLFCFDSSSGYCVAYRPAAEGSNCGDGSHCLDGRCVAENENIIPDYSQHTPSYASPNSYNQALNTDKYIYNDDTATKATTTTTTPQTSTTTRTTTTRRTTTPLPTTTTQSSYFNTKSTIRSYFNNAFFNSFSKFTSTVEPKSNYNYNYDRTTISSRPTIPTTTTTQRPIPTTIFPPITQSKFKFNFFDNFFKTTTRLPTTTTTTTTTELPYYYEVNDDQSNYNNNNNNNEDEETHNTYDGYDYTTYPTIVTTTPATTKAPIYPYFVTNSFNRLSIPTTKYPYYNPTLTTKRLTTPTVRPTIPQTTKPSTTLYNNPPSSTQFTRHPVFDVYFKRSTTKNPYDFSNFNQYFKTSSPRYSSNYFGSNSNNFMVNATSLNQG